jgi:hypothetical protein
MSEYKALTFKDISYIRAAIEGYIGQLKFDIESAELDDDERLDTQEDLLYYDKLPNTFQKQKSSQLI